jgi:type IV pilus assembly protein PilM
MLSFVQSWFKPGANPIGVDFGTDTLRLAQVELTAGGEFHLVAAASADVPPHVRTDPAARLDFFTETTRELLSSGGFRGRKAVLALPAASMFIQHLRMPKLDEAEMKKALPFEAAGKLPIDPSFALLRHVVAGEVYQDQEQKNEIVLMAASRELVNQLLAAASKARLDVVGMNVEPKALVDCFGHVYRRKNDVEVTTLFVDIGAAASRAVIARGTQILFARVIPVGGDHFSRAVAAGLKTSLDEAKVLRIKLAQMQPLAVTEVKSIAPKVEAQLTRAPAAPTAVESDENHSFALLGAGLSQAKKRREATSNGGGGGGGGASGGATDDATAIAIESATATACPSGTPGAETSDESARVEFACREPLARLVEELGLCRRYYESCFPSTPVDRLVFVGGEARQTWLCQGIAREMMLSAQLGDPLLRMAKTTEIGIESGIDRKQPQPAWAVALGLSMGPAAGEAK